MTYPSVARIVGEVLQYDDGRRYDLHCYVLMPDHYHALMCPLPRGDGFVPLSEIMQAIKGISARRINRLSGVRGSLWLEEGYTRIIRCEIEYRETRHYIRSNPVQRATWPILIDGRGSGLADKRCADGGVRTTEMDCCADGGVRTRTH